MLFVFVRLCLQLFVGGLSMLFVFVRLCLQLFVGGLSMLFVTRDKDKQTQIT
jgi:hypothetical protein